MITSLSTIIISIKVEITFLLLELKFYIQYLK